MDLSDFDAALTWTSFEPHMHKAKTERQKKRLASVVRHSRGEVEADIAAVLPTLMPDPQYHEYGVFGNTIEDTGPKGLDAVKANYDEMVRCGSYVIESKKLRVVVSDEEIVTEGTFRQILTAEVAKAMGFVEPSDESSDFYMLTARTVVFWDFDDNDLASEDRCVLAHKIVPLAESDLPANYPDRLRKSSKVAV